MPALPRVAMTMEQSWHRVPGGTATSVLALAAALADAHLVDLVGVTAYHRHPPAHESLRPSVPTKALPLPRVALYEAWQRGRWPAVQRVTGPVDLVHATTMAIPPPGGAPLVVTVHDLAFLADPEHFTARGNRFFRRGLQRVAADADLVLVPSQVVRQDCVDQGLAADRIMVVPHGVGPSRASGDEVARVRARHGLTAPYLLWTGTQEPRKNLVGLLDAYDRLQADVDLVVVGPPGWGPQFGARLAATPRVTTLGWVEGSQRDALYAGAELFVYPSLREGFGLPVLEAMAQGTPAVTSAGTSMAEFAVGALVEPTDPVALAGAIDELLADPARREQLADDAREVGDAMTWDAAARATAQAYQRVL